MSVDLLGLSRNRELLSRASRDDCGPLDSKRRHTPWPVGLANSAR